MDFGTPLPRYYPLPQFLLDLNISSTSKILYALLLNRANLSQKNTWKDENGHVYFVYTIEDWAANNYNKSNNYYTRLITEMDYHLKKEKVFDGHTEGGCD